MPDLSLCFFDHLCFLECFELESESDDDVPEDSPSGSSGEWSEDASDMFGCCLFCSGSWNHGWLFFHFLDVLDCLADCATGAFWSLAGVSSNWSRNTSMMSSCTCCSHCCWRFPLGWGILAAVGSHSSLSLDFLLLLTCQRCANCSSVAAIWDAIVLFAVFCAF